MSRQEWTRQWLRGNAERVLRERTAEWLFVDQFARDALAKLQKREQVLGLVRRLNRDTPRINVLMRDAWTLDQVRESWAHDLVEVGVAEAHTQGVHLKPGRTRRVVENWLNHDPAAAAAVQRIPQSLKVPRDLSTTRFMELLVDKIREGADLLSALAPDISIGEELPERARTCQIHLMRFLRSHAVLVNRDADGPWREATLLDTWTGLGFTVDGLQDVPRVDPVVPAGPRRFELNTGDLPEAAAHPTLPLSEVLRELTIGFRRKQSAVHPWLVEPADIPPPPEAPREVRLESGIIVSAETYQDIQRPHIVARYDLPAIASLVVTQLEGLVHQAAYAQGYPITVAPHVRDSLVALHARRGLSAQLLDELAGFFRDGLSSPRFRFAHGTLGDKFVRETFAIACDGMNLWNDLLNEVGERLPTVRTAWWWGQRGWWDHSIGFVRRFAEIHGSTEPMIDHIFDVPKLLEDISPNHIPYWQLASSCHRYPGCTHTTHWALAHICVPMVEAILRNVAEIFGFKTVKVGRVQNGHRFDFALLNERELLAEPFLATFWPDALRLRDGRRTLALFLRIRNALAHGEILALDLRGIDVVRFSLLVASIFLWPLRLTGR